MRSGNPALSESTFLDLASGSVVTHPDQAMTLNGTVNKTGILLLLSVLTAAFAWTQSVVTGPDGTAMVAPGVTIYALGGAIGGFILAMVTVFKKTWSPVTAPLYALVEGFFLGAISAVFELKYPGIVFQAVVLTFGIGQGILAINFIGNVKEQVDVIGRERLPRTLAVARSVLVAATFLATVYFARWQGRLPAA